MLTNSRQSKILEIAKRDGEVIISKVAKELDVSLETIRRDINCLCKNNQLEKVHGGAVPLKITDYEDKYQKRKATNSVVKGKLGEAASGAFDGKKVVMISSGTTLEAVADAVNLQSDMLVITNSLTVSEIFGKKESGQVLLVGGYLNAEERFTFGSEVLRGIEKYRSDIAVISCVGIDETGAMCSSSEEGLIISSMMKSSSKVLLIADSSKFGKKSVYKFCKLSEIDQILTDNKNPLSDKLLKAIGKEKTKLKIV